MTSLRLGSDDDNINISLLWGGFGDKVLKNVGLGIDLRRINDQTQLKTRSWAKYQRSYCLNRAERFVLLAPLLTAMVAPQAQATYDYGLENESSATWRLAQSVLSRTVQ